MIVVDVETTGIISYKHAIVSIGALDFHQPTNQFYGQCRIDAKTEVDRRALAVNGYSLKQLTDMTKPSLAELIQEFDTWAQPIADKTLAGMNTAFDLSMLRAGYKMHMPQLRFPFGYRNLDLHTLTYAHHIGRNQPVPMAKERTNLDSDAVQKYVGLPAEPKPHIAINGAKYEAEALSRLVMGVNLLPEFKKYQIPGYLKRN